MKQTRFLLASIVALVASLVAVGVVAQSRTFDDLTEVVTVEVPVHVIDDGGPVRGLTAANFVVRDGRKKQAITGFEVIDLAEFQDAPGERVDRVPLAGRRHFLFLFDLSFSDPEAITRARHAALDLIETELHGSDLVAVGTYTVQQGPSLVLGFTSDRYQATHAIQTLGLASLANKVVDPLGFLLAKPGSADISEGGGGVSTGSDVAGAGSTGLNVDAMVRENLQDLSIATDRANRDLVRNRVLNMTQGLELIGNMLAEVEGRKHVVFLSEGIDSTVLLGTTDRERMAELNRAAEAGEHWRIDSDERYGNTAAIQVLETMYDAFRRSDAVIQAVDVGGLRAEHGAPSNAEETLFMFANQTGGELYRNFNDLGSAMGQLLDRTSVTYILSFQPEDLELDGSYHNIDVKLVGGPSGSRVVHRPGYYAPKPFSAKSGLERRLDAADLILRGTDGGQLESAVLAAPFRFQGPLSYVPVLVEIDGGSLLSAAEAETLALEIYGYAIRGDGSIGDFFTQQMGLEMAKVEAALRQSGVKFFGSFDLPPGEYAVRILVRESSSGWSSVRSFPLEVPAFEEGEPVLLAPLFPEAPGKWLMVKQADSDEEERGVPYPFMIGEKAYVPAARPVISGSDPAALAVIGYDVDPSMSVEATVLDSSGQEVSGPSLGPMEIVSSEPRTARLKGIFYPNDLAPGEYTLVLEASDGSGSAVSSSAPFVVEG